MGKWHLYQANNFGQSDQDTAIHVYLIWGLNGVDDSGCHRSDLDCIPKPVYDEAFDLTFHTMQNSVIDFCNQLKSVDVVTEGSLYLRRSATIDSQTGDNPLEVSCFMLAQEKFFNNTNTSLPFDLKDLAILVNENPSLYPPSVYGAVGSVQYPRSGTYYRPYELSALHWLLDGSLSPFPSPDYTMYSNFLGGSADTLLLRNDSSLTYAGKVNKRIPHICINKKGK